MGHALGILAANPRTGYAPDVEGKKLEERRKGMRLDLENAARVIALSSGLFGGRRGGEARVPEDGPVRSGGEGEDTGIIKEVETELFAEEEDAISSR